MARTARSVNRRVRITEVRISDSLLYVTVQGKMVLWVNFLDFVILNNFVTITIRESKTIVIFIKRPLIIEL